MLEFYHGENENIVICAPLLNDRLISIQLFYISHKYLSWNSNHLPVTHFFSSSKNKWSMKNSISISNKNAQIAFSLKKKKKQERERKERLSCVGMRQVCSWYASRFSTQSIKNVKGCHSNQ